MAGPFDNLFEKELPITTGFVIRYLMPEFRTLLRAFAMLVFVVAVGGAARAQTATLTANTTALNAAGGTITFTFSTTFSGTAIVGFAVLAPDTWAYRSGTGEPANKPKVGDTAAFEWFDVSPVSSSVSFTFVLAYPAGTTSGSVVPSVYLRPPGGALVTLVPATLNFGSGTNPAIAVHPASQTVNAGSPATFGVTAAGTTPFTYQWTKGSAPIAGATAATLTLNNVQTADAGAYAVTVSNSVGAVTSNSATLSVTVTPPTITLQPVGAVLNPGANFTSAVTASGSAPLSYQWSKDGASIAGATAATLALSNVQVANAGSYTVTVSNGAGAITSNSATLTISSALIAPTLTQQPVNVAVAAGASASFSVVASGSAPLSYQWSKDGASIAGATTATLALSNVQTANAGSYTVVVSNGAGAITSNTATLTISSALIAPTLSQQPVNVAVAVGASASFSVVAGGSAPLSYQWRKDGASIAGATAATLALSNVQTAHAGSYTVVVSNSAGAVTSNVAVLTVGGVLSAAPTITTPPADAATVANGTARFAVVAGGTTPLSYQWRKNGTPISGATLTQLTLANVQPADAGVYSVVVSNGAGAITSNTATLTVIFSRISNLSVRANLESGQTLTVGFVTSGTKQLLTRAIGPGLVPFGITSGFVADPKMALVSQATGATVAQNDNWGSILADAFASVGAFPLEAGSKDAGLLYPVSGPHTLQVNGAGAGLVLVEVYDAESTTAGRLSNVSARNQVGTGANILIAGFVIGGTGDRMLLIRGIGPALKEVFGVSGALVDPKLEIYRQDNTKIVENDDWGPTLASTFEQVGAFRLPAGSKDSAVLLVVRPGAYTAQLSGVGGTTGDGIIEVYEVP